MQISFGLDKLPKLGASGLENKRVTHALVNHTKHMPDSEKVPIRLDVARIYKLGESESFVKNLIINTRRSNFHVSTKVGLSYVEDKMKFERTFDKESLRSQLESSIEALGSAPDRLYLHWPHRLDSEITVDAIKILADLNKEYGIKELGICNIHAYPEIYSGEYFLNKIRELGASFVQDRINLLEWDERFWTTLKDKGFKIVSHSSLCNGLLTEQSVISQKNIYRKIPNTLVHANKKKLACDIKCFYDHIVASARAQDISINLLIWLSHHHLLGADGEMCIGISNSLHVKEVLRLIKMRERGITQDISLVRPWKVDGLLRALPARF